MNKLAQNIGRFTPGTKFVGNVNQKEMEIVGFKVCRCGFRCRCHETIQYRCSSTGKVFSTTVDMLERCDVTIKPGPSGPFIMQ